MSFLGDILGTENDYRASPNNAENPYAQSAIQQQLNNQGFAVTGQKDLAGMLQAQAAGLGPSASQTLLNNAQAQNAAAMNSAIAGNRGVNAGMAMRQAMNQTALNNQALAGQAAAARQQEQMNAQGLLNNVYGNIGQQSIQSQALMNQANLGTQQINAGITQGNTHDKNQLTGGFINSLGGASAAYLGKSHGGFIEGAAPIPGDSPKNDIVPTMLSPGEIVIPRSHSSDPESAKAFIDHIMSPVGKERSYRSVLEAQRRLEEARAALEARKSPKKMSDGGEVTPDYGDDAEGRAAQGLMSMYNAAKNSPTVQKALDFSGNLNSYYNMANSAAHGDPDAQKSLIDDHLATVAGTVRATPTGKLLGTVEPEMASSRMVQAGLRNEAKQSGLEFGSQRAIKAPAIGERYADIKPVEKPIPMAEQVKARFGDDVPDAYWEKLQSKAEKNNTPYEPIIYKGKHAGFFPNEEAVPSGMIGNPKDFANPNDAKIFERDPFGWYDMKYGATKRLLEKHAEAGLPAHVTTASDLIAHDDYVNALPRNSHVNLVLTNPLDGERGFNNPFPSNKRMLTAYDKLKKQGVSATVLVRDPATKTLKPLDPFTLKKLQNAENAFWSPTEAAE